MLISILSASTRTNRKSHRVALFLEKNIRENTPHDAQILDLVVCNFPIFEEEFSRHPNPPMGLHDFAAQIERSDACIFVSPEYNGSYTSALKNAVDMLRDQAFSQKVIGVSSITTGGNGGMRAAIEMQNLALAVGGFALPQMLLVPQVHLKFDENGELTDEVFSKNISNFLSKFIWLAEAVFAKKSIQ